MSGDLDQGVDDRIRHYGPIRMEEQSPISDELNVEAQFRKAQVQPSSVETTDVFISFCDIAFVVSFCFTFKSLRLVRRLLPCDI